MSLLPREASYAEEVADFFLAFRGSGLALSALDTELLLAWQSRGIPYPVVCRGIRRAAEAHARDARPGEPALRTLRACARTVDEEWRRFQGLSAGKSEPKTPPRAAHDRLARARAVLSKAAREGTPAVAAAARLLHDHAQAEAPDPAAAAAIVARLDEAFALRYLRKLAFPERLALLRAAHEPLAGALVRMSPRARKAALRAHRVLQARSHGALPSLK